MTDLIVILGPTASGKTEFAISFANRCNGEIISADSRQVYRKMDIGTGKDLDAYTKFGANVPYHLIDICEPGTRYYLSDFQRDFKIAFTDIQQRGKQAILCGGTGLYIESVLRSFNRTEIPVNNELRISLELFSHEKLISIYHTYPDHLKPHNIDLSTSKRAIRAIEIVDFLRNNPEFSFSPQETFSYKVYGLNPDLETRRNKIEARLISRLKSGLIEEVENLRKDGVSDEMLKYYGLEYKFVTEYLNGDYTYTKMVELLQTAIRQFAKRQMTYFRKIEKAGIKIEWITFDSMC